jgi:hypothetical protein
MSMVHLHLLLNHVPVIGMFIGLGLLAYALLRKDVGLLRVCLGLFAILAIVALATFLTGEPAEEAVEGLAGVSESVLERHEEAALQATIALGALGLLSLGLLLRFRRRALPLKAGVIVLFAAFVPALAMAWTANLGGQIRHSEIRAQTAPPPATLAGATGGAEAPAEPE